MENKAKIRINLNLREFEIEGSEAFINSHSAKIESFLEILKTAPPVITEPKIHHKDKEGSEIKTDKVRSTNKSHSEDIPETFGEYYHKMPKKSTESDKILLAGHFIQSKSEDNLFTTKEANAALLEQGVKLSNPTVFVNRCEKSKHIIKISKGKFRVSKTGLEHIKQLLTEQTEK
ncbi:MAG: hypothetical protein N2235_07655 [Fischerella sp.]|nr:hypothetical protein [Fischerella sp.]